jgi:hypothetical protein
VQAQGAREEAQWLGRRTWMQEREQKWDAHHEDDKLWGGRHHKYHRKNHERSRTRPRSERERKRQDREDGRRRARGLATCGYTAGRRTIEALTAAAATEAQTAAQSAADTQARTQAKFSTPTGEMVGDSKTPNPEPEGTHLHRRIEHDSKTPDITERHERTTTRPGSNFQLDHGT